MGSAPGVFGDLCSLPSQPFVLRARTILSLQQYCRRADDRVKERGESHDLVAGGRSKARARVACQIHTGYALSEYSRPGAKDAVLFCIEI